MSQPIRLRDGNDVELRELMRYAQAQDTPSTANIDALTARVLAELTAPAAEPAAARSALGASTAKWLIGIAILSALGAVAYRRIDAPRAPDRVPQAHTAPVVAATQPSTPPSAQPIAVVPSAPPAQAAELAPPKPLRARAKPRVSKSAASSEPASPADPMAEVMLLQRARRALLSEPQAALALAAQHQREHPAGMFAEEREAIAIEALWRQGDAEAAETRLRAMLLAYPRSSYRERLLALLEQAGPSP